MHPALAPIVLVSTLLFSAASTAQAETLIYATGFEAPDYATGPIGGGYYSQPQWVAANGWGAWPNQPYTIDPSPWAVVSTQRAASGDQALRLSIDPATNGQIGVWRSFYPNSVGLAPTGGQVFGMAMDLYLEQAANSDVTWSVGLQGSVPLGFSFTPDGRLYYATAAQSQGAYFQPGFDIHNTWLHVSLESDPAGYGMTLTVSGRGQTFQQAVANPGYSANQFSFGGGWPTFPTYQPGVAYMDNLRIGYNLAPVPEPAPAALWLLGAVAWLGWRRRFNAA